MCVAKGCQKSKEIIKTIFNLVAVVSYSLSNGVCILFLFYPRCVVLLVVKVEDDHEKVTSPGSSKNVNAVSLDGDINYNDCSNDREINIKALHSKDYIIITERTRLFWIQILKWDKEVQEAPPENHTEL